MPRGKELEQLPAASTLPEVGENMDSYDRKSLEGAVQKEQPKPADIVKENEDMI